MDRDSPEALLKGHVLVSSPRVMVSSLNPSEATAVLYMYYRAHKQQVFKDGEPDLTH